MERLCQLSMHLDPLAKDDPRNYRSYRHILSIVPDDQPFDLSVPEDDLSLWNRLHRELRGKESCLPGPVWIRA